uniref:Uncharacterized protein n=1 Tax=Arion vulgaris TaxID=1028688 RepID=A0A0B6ZZV6_9EUPU
MFHNLIHLVLLAAALIITITSAQSVVQQCMSEQITNKLSKNGNNQKNITPEATTTAAFESICHNYANYMNCFQARLHLSDHPADRFLQLIFSQPDMLRAYKGLCTQDLEMCL